jgi:hypothetical protein
MFNVNSILEKADLVSLVEHAGAAPHKSGSEFRCACPIHGSHDANSFAIYENGRKWKCFSGDCGQGDAIDFVMVWQGFDFRRACQFLGGDVTSDPAEMHRLAAERHAKAEQELQAAHAKEEARRTELQQAAKHLIYHETMKEWARQMWIERGIDECYQGLWFLGACDDKAIMSKGIEYHTPTLTIPIFDQKYQVLNIKHRLINPPDPKDKYRPENSGLGTPPPFLAFPEYGYDGKTVYVIEGEIKSMVAATITDDATNQFIGIPGKIHYTKIAEQLKGKNIVTVPDPGAEKEAVEFCRATGSHYMPLPDKIDDMILANGYDGDWLKSVTKQARRIK